MPHKSIWKGLYVYKNQPLDRTSLYPFCAFMLSERISITDSGLLNSVMQPH